MKAFVLQLLYVYAAFKTGVVSDYVDYSSSERFVGIRISCKCLAFARGHVPPRFTINPRTSADECYNSRVTDFVVIKAILCTATHTRTRTHTYI